MDTLGIYNILRKHHQKIFREIDAKELNDYQLEALDTLKGVFYLVESVFAKEE